MLKKEAFHDSRNPFFRSPSGAVTCGTTVHLRICAHNDIRDPVLRLWKDGETRVPMTKVAEESEFPETTVWEAKINAPDTPCLFWYYFLLGDSVYYGNAQDCLGGEGTLSDYEPPSYQITVYDPEFKAPKWLREGVMYQIFVDRFFNGQSKTMSALADLPEEGYASGRLNAESAFDAAVGAEAGMAWDADAANEPAANDGDGQSIRYPLLSHMEDAGLDNPVYIKRRHDVTLHNDWYEPPYFKPNEFGDNTADDFFGGNLLGIIEKLDYLKSLGVTVIYLNPIFRAHSNHKYDTGDYHSIDPMYGDNADFDRLCEEAASRGIRVIIDGVFSHTGDDSIYFNKYGRYMSLGAYQSKYSDYAKWYTFSNFPDEYASWWHVKTLPETNELEPSFLDFIVKNEQSVAKVWVRRGASGWRLDVADELPMEFLRLLRKNVKATDPSATLIGEVWEDASNKVSYGFMRSYTLGDTLDSVINYPMRDYVIRFLIGDIPSGTLTRGMESLYENYPAEFAYSLMNVIGTHDRSRILNILAEHDVQVVPREEWRNSRIPPEKEALGKKRLRLMLWYVVGLPGIPCIYYGDEAGVPGLADPFNRGTFPWGREDATLQSFFRETLNSRHMRIELKTGEIKLLCPHDDVAGIVRRIRDNTTVFGDPGGNAATVILINRSAEPVSVAVSYKDVGFDRLISQGGEHYEQSAGKFNFIIPAYGAIVACSH